MLGNACCCTAWLGLLHTLPFFTSSCFTADKGQGQGRSGAAAGADASSNNCKQAKPKAEANSDGRKKKEGPSILQGHAAGTQRLKERGSASLPLPLENPHGQGRGGCSIADGHRPDGPCVEGGPPSIRSLGSRSGRRKEQTKPHGPPMRAPSRRAQTDEQEGRQPSTQAPAAGEQG